MLDLGLVIASPRVPTDQLDHGAETRRTLEHRPSEAFRIVEFSNLEESEQWLQVLPEEQKPQLQVPSAHTSNPPDDGPNGDGRSLESGVTPGTGAVDRAGCQPLATREN